MKKGDLFLSILILFFTFSNCERDSKNKCKDCSTVNLNNCDTSGIETSEACCLSTGPTQIYKTRCDYSDNVSVKLSEDKTEIVAYPGITDVENQRPVQLANGYWLKKMVGNAFISITIDEYKNLSSQPSIDDLMNMVIDDDPFCEFYECCKLCLWDEIEINNLILENKLCNCDSVGWWIFNK